MTSAVHTHKKRRSSARRGAVLAVALVAFVAAAAILFTILQAALRQHRQVRDQQNLVQARLLAQAGVDRGLAKLRQSSAFRAETWRLEPSEFDGLGPAEVRIQVEPMAGQPAEFRISAEADFPSDTEHRAQQTQTATVRLKPTEQQP
jgi:hypothetical protein